MHLRDIPVDRLTDALEAHGIADPALLSRRLGAAIHAGGALTWDDLGERGIGWRFRATLREKFEFGPLLHVDGFRVSPHDGARKWMLRLGSSETIESVAIPRYDNRTLCVSSQAGCAMACSFCATGRLPLRRNLTAGEITESVVHAERALRADGETGRITDVVFMGMGEPLHNAAAVLDACTNLNSHAGHGIARKRITISTVGLVREIRRLTEERRRWVLHVSLHSAIQETRERIVPAARANPLPDLIDALRERQEVLGVKWTTFQYVLLPGVNDDAAHVEAIGRTLAGLRYIVNVIPWNDTGSGFRAPTWDEVRRFTSRLRELHCPVKVRYSAGKRDGMGCGQLAAETLSWQQTGGHMAAPPGIFTA